MIGSYNAEFPPAGVTRPLTFAVGLTNMHRFRNGCHIGGCIAKQYILSAFVACLFEVAVYWRIPGPPWYAAILSGLWKA